MKKKKKKWENKEYWEKKENKNTNKNLCRSKKLSNFLIEQFLEEKKQAKN